MLAENGSVGGKGRRQTHQFRTCFLTMSGFDTRPGRGVQRNFTDVPGSGGEPDELNAEECRSLRPNREMVAFCIRD